MTAPSVALYANSSFGDEAMADCDVLVRKSDIENVAEAVYKARCTRGNLAYASRLAVSVGFAEALVMLFMLLTGTAVLPSATVMLMVNIFVVFVPSLVISVFASVHHRVDQKELFAIRCALEGIVCALFALAAQNLIAFVVIYSILDAARVCAMYNNLEKGRWGIRGLATLAGAFVASVLILKVSISVIAFAALAAALNALVPHIKLKGLKK